MAFVRLYLLIVLLFLVLTVDGSVSTTPVTVKSETKPLTGPLLTNLTSLTTSSTTDKSSQPVITTEFKRVCRGTQTGLGYTEGHYDQYRARYTNCTYVDGNLELVFLTNASYDMSFLRHIREVTGYVLIVVCYMDYIPLNSLRVIRGRTLYEHNGRYYSLYVALNYDEKKENVGLKELQLTSLHEIFSGSVFLYRNNYLCFDDTIEWRDILSGEGAEVVTERHRLRTCGKCHETCTNFGQLNCWGSGPDHCQKLTKMLCSPQCDERCFGPLPNQCCHEECAAGCTGRTKSMCWACRNFDNDNSCENFCPPEYVYSQALYRQVPNPDAKYAYGALCVDKCPSHLIADRGACVQDCGAGHVAGPDNKCVDCDGPCPKVCVFPHDFVNHNNIRNLSGCTLVQGHLKILDSAFDGDSYYDVPPMSVKDLSILETVKEVTDFVLVQASHMQFRSLSFLRNLEVINGRKLGSGGTSLQIFQTSVETLGLVSLREVRNGHIYIANNSRLCYASSVNWHNIRMSPKQTVLIQYNRNQSQCEADNEVCSSECSDEGCWGPLDDQCVSCLNFRLGRRCINRCEAVTGVYISGPRECQYCHPECQHNCSGDGADMCDNCRNARDGPYCVAECPNFKYRDENGVCQDCHPNCAASTGCTGGRNSIGEGACRSCPLVVVSDDDRNNVSQCLPADADCDDGYYKNNFDPMPGVKACIRCHPECQTCSGPGLSFCNSCVHFKQDNRCVAKCSPDYYVDAQYGISNGASQCKRCNSRCLTCTGSSARDCITCVEYKVYYDLADGSGDGRFNCTEKCPEFAPHRETLRKGNETESVCLSEDSYHKKRYVIIAAALGSLLMFIMAVITACLCKQKRRVEQAKQKLKATMEGCEETVPINPSNAAPDMSLLTLIKESDIIRGRIIGSGAFGTVYEGHWLGSPDKRVAIKILQEGTSPSHNKELLQEARIMASVSHPCCVRIQAVCMTAHMMLISELLPTGSLLDYVRDPQYKLMPATLLLWAKQIAEGMEHLESKQIVHRDLAARNVLVQSATQVKITDFGLAKVLELNQYQVYAGGGKMPIKWLALECILHRKFTHKSDVWSYGVTLWEMFSYGKRPYGNTPAIDLPDLLERGERLPQPSICTADVYLLMATCWRVNAEDRPSFKDLVEKFDKMYAEPDRYLHDQCKSYMDSAADFYPHNVDGRYLSPQPPVLAVTDPGAGVNGATASTSRSRHNSRNRHSSSGSTGTLPPSSRTNDSLRYCADPCAASVAETSGRSQQPTVSDDYMQPIYEGTLTSKRDSVTIEEREDSIHHDDGFDSEATTMTPVSSRNDYYNSLDHIWVKQRPFDNCTKPKPTRGNSESIGSLDTDVSEHDYYNELHSPVMSDFAFLDRNGTANGVM